MFNFRLFFLYFFLLAVSSPLDDLSTLALPLLLPSLALPLPLLLPQTDLFFYRSLSTTFLSAVSWLAVSLADSLSFFLLAVS